VHAAEGMDSIRELVGWYGSLGNYQMIFSLSFVSHSPVTIRYFYFIVFSFNSLSIYVPLKCLLIVMLRTNQKSKELYLAGYI